MSDPKPQELGDRGALRGVLVRGLADALGKAPHELDPSAPFSTFGLDSIKAFTMTGDLAEWLDQELPATLFWDHPSIDALTEYLAEKIGLPPTA